MKDQQLTSDAARILSALGASKGGHARAAKLSPAQRSEIARRAAQARWSHGSDERPRISPVREARALAAEWIDAVRRTDTAWREAYTPAELDAVDAALDRFAASLPVPGESLFFRLGEGD